MVTRRVIFESVLTHCSDDVIYMPPLCRKYGIRRCRVFEPAWHAMQLVRFKF